MAAVAQAAQAMAQPNCGLHAHDVSASSNLSGDARNSTTTTTPPPTKSAQHTPPSSVSATPSPASCSPTSPHQQPSAFAKRDVRPNQIGRPKNVGFVPAALRPTTRPREAGHVKAHSVAGLRNGPPTPPYSLHNSSDNLAGAGQAAQTANTQTSSSRTSPDSSHSGKTINNSKLTPLDTQMPADNNSASGPASARPGTRGSIILASPTTSLSTLSLSSIMAQQAPHPTRAHWKPDAMAASCDESSCTITFSTFNRRHHCRRCGYIFCSRHVARRVPLDSNACAVPTPLLSADGSAASTPQLGQIGTAGSSPDENDGNPEVGWWRACERCYSEWVEWVEGLQQQRAAGESTTFSDRMYLPGTLTVPKNAQRNASISGSVPRDWNWSTF